MNKRKTNEQAIRNIMNYSNYGALAQIFVVDALLKQATAVANMNPEDVKSGLVNGAAWVGVAKEIRDKLNEHLEP